ncbi:MAG: 3-hydroxyacyl-CoA dehydrogenase NAD-binding domain-containing protein, partial [Burkholderiaceae bacterium]
MQQPSRTGRAAFINELIALGAPPSVPDMPPARVGLIGDPSNADAALAQAIATADHSSQWVTPVAEAGWSDQISDLQDCSLVIDLTADRHPQKPAIFAALDKLAAAGCAIGSPCISQSATAAFASLAHRQRWVGLSLSVPWESRQLFEVMAHNHTAPDVITQVTGFAHGLGQPVLQVADRAGGLSWRIQCAYLFEAMALLGEAISADRIESTALELGMRAGPFAELDRVSLKLIDHILHAELHELAHRASKHDSHDHEHHGHEQHSHESHDADDHHQAHPHDHGHGHDGHSHDHQEHTHAHGVKSELMPESAVYVMEKMAHGFNRLGREAGAGFYDYDYEDDPPELWEGLSAFARGSHKADPGDCADRLLMAPTIQMLHGISKNPNVNATQASLAA